MMVSWGATAGACCFTCSKPVYGVQLADTLLAALVFAGEAWQQDGIP